MEGYNAGGNEDDEFNAGSFANASAYGDGSETRDFLSHAPPFAGSGAHTSFRSNSGDGFGNSSSFGNNCGDGFGNSSGFGFGNSSGFGFANNSGYGFGNHAPSPSHLGLSALDLNAGQSWPGMAGYQDILQSPAQDGGSGSTHGPPPLRVPARAGRGSLGLRPPRRAGGGSGGHPPRGTSGDEAGGSGGGSRRPGTRRNLAQPAPAADVPPTNVPDNKLKGPLPDYIDLLDRMFLGVAVTGETAYAPGRRNAALSVSSDDDDDDDVRTPQSTGSKRSYSSLSTRSTAASPSKRSRSPAVRMNENVRNLTLSLDNRTEAMKEIWCERKQAVEDKQKEKLSTIDKVLELAKEAGASEDNERQWIGVLMITQSEATMRVFIKSSPKGRMAIINHYAGVVN